MRDEADFDIKGNALRRESKGKKTGEGSGRQCRCLKILIPERDVLQRELNGVNFDTSQGANRRVCRGSGRGRSSDVDISDVANVNM